MRVRPKPAKPGSLLFGVSARANLDAFDRLFERAPAFEMIDDLLVSQRLACIAAKFSRGEKTTHFVDQSAGDHGFDAGVDATVDFFHGIVQADDNGRLGYGRFPGLLRVPL